MSLKTEITKNEMLLMYLNRIEEMHKEIDALKKQLAIALPADTGDDSLVNVRRLRAKLAAAKAVLEEVRPLVRARIWDWPEADQGILGRIAAVLEDKP